MRVVDGAFHFPLNGVAGESYQVYTTTDFGTWEPILNVLVTPGSAFLDVVIEGWGADDYRFFKVEFLP
ncbi:hypothetical protein GC207_08950 [bacterium]|nr:hypothetical protein [bacterium]